MIHNIRVKTTSKPAKHQQTLQNPILKELPSKANFTGSSGHFIAESSPKRLKNKRSFSARFLEKPNEENSLKDIPKLTTRVFKKANCRSLVILGNQSPSCSPRKLKNLNPKIKTWGDILISSESLESTEVPANSLSPSPRLYLDLFDHNRERSKSPCFGGGKVSSNQVAKTSLQAIDFGAKVAKKINGLIKGHYTYQERSEISLLIERLKVQGQKQRSPTKSRTTFH